MKEVKGKRKNKNLSKKNNVQRKKKIAKIVPSDTISLKQVEGPDLKELELDIKKDILFQPPHKRNFLPIFILLFIVFVIAFIGMHILVPTITINGDNPLEITYQDQYVEQGAKAKFLGKDLTSKVKISGAVDTSKIGTYTVSYFVQESIFNVHQERMVFVVDKKAPSITLKGDFDVNICPNSEFKEIGYEAIDDYDGDLTDKVQIKNKNDEVIYSVKDTSGNATSVVRKIHKIDTTKPTITLKGNQTTYLRLDEVYQEPGYTATDNCSGDLTDKVKVTGSVTSGKEGTYTLVYEVVDDSNNKTTVERKVIVAQGTDPNSGVAKKGIIYLTFDDGPSNVTTGAILDVLKEEGVKATFFVTNNGPDYLIKRIFDEGHTVALHTATHNYATVYQSVDAYFNDLKIVSDRVKRITGQTSKIIRFPGGSSNTISRRYCSGIMSTLVNEVLSRGYRYYDWNIDSQDAEGANKDQIYYNVTSNLSKNKVNMVLMHDIKTATRDAIRNIIRYGKEHGYTFERIDMDTYMVRQRVNN